MKVLITFALANEFAPWRKLRFFRNVSLEPWDPTYAARIGNADVCVVITGAGRFAAQRSVEKAFEELSAVFDICIAAGLSGALQPSHRPGQILTARSVSDVQGTKSLCADAELVSRASTMGAKIVERFLLSDKVVSTADMKRSLSAFGDAVDMESLHILAMAAQREIRSVAIRAISDGVESDLPLDFDHVFTSRGAVSVSRVIGQVARRPGRIGRLVRLAHDSRRAATALATFLDRYIDGLEEGPLTELAKAEALAI